MKFEMACLKCPPEQVFQLCRNYGRIAFVICFCEEIVFYRAHFYVPTPILAPDCLGKAKFGRKVEAPRRGFSIKRYKLNIISRPRWMK